MVRTWAGLLTMVCVAWAQRPSDDDSAALIERSRQKTREYTRSLPDFECTEVVQRYATTDPEKPGVVSPTDKLTIRIRYAQHKEDHTLVLIDDKPTDRTFESLAGATGSGEFGATLSSIFDPATKTAFHRESWRTERKHRVAVYNYVVEQARSRYTLTTGEGTQRRQAVVGYHGVLEIESETGEVLHFTFVADHLPKDIMLLSASTTVDYSWADVGGRDYLLPWRSVAEVRSPTVSARNEMEFREYHKFSADSSIEFGPVK